VVISPIESNVPLSSGTMEALVEAISPAPHLFVFGDGPDALPLVRLARGIGWTVTVCQWRARFENLARFAAADHVRTGPAARLAEHVDAAACPLAVVMTNDAGQDREALAMLVGSRARYIGVLGPRSRTEGLLPGLNRIATASRPIHAPAGLAIGAETPAEIALSILAEAQAVLAGETAGRLSGRLEPIHWGRSRLEAAPPFSDDPLAAAGG